MVPLLVPLFISAFRRATDLAMAMEARCYRGGEGRTKMKPLHYEKRDRAAVRCLRTVSGDRAGGTDDLAVAQTSERKYT